MAEQLAGNPPDSFRQGDPGELAGDVNSDPALDFCNAFWGDGDDGYTRIMTRLRGAGQTADELREFWKERAAIEEEYAKRLAKLAKTPLGQAEIGDLAASLKAVQLETSKQAQSHLQLGSEIRETVEKPTTLLSNRLVNLKRGYQASVEKSFRNKNLQEGHAMKARERYEAECIKLNGYTANLQLVQGKEAEKLQHKMERSRQAIEQYEEDFRNFVNVLQTTSGKWENEWRSFCDTVQDAEDRRLGEMKDIIWTYANAVSTVCVDDDASCERIREELEQFEPANDQVNFVRSFGTNNQIPDPPRFINYSAGEYPSRPTYHLANFRRLSVRPIATTVPADEPTPQSPQKAASTEEPVGKEPAAPAGYQSSVMPPSSVVDDLPPPPAPKDEPVSTTSPTKAMERLALRDETQSNAPSNPSKSPFGGVALPGLTASPEATTQRLSEMPPPPIPPSGPAADSYGLPQSTSPTQSLFHPSQPQQVPAPTGSTIRDVVEDQDAMDPMAAALAALRQNPPGPSSVRRAPSQKRPDSLYSTGSMRGNTQPLNVRSPSPAISAVSGFTGYQTSVQLPQHMSSGLIPPASGHTAAALAKSMADFERQSSRDNRGSVNYANYADDIVGSHPSRPSSPGVGARAPSPAMMQPPQQPTTHIADEVVSKYQQAFPGERSHSRPTSIYSGHSRRNSDVGSINPPPSPGAAIRQGFAGVGAGSRSPSPQPQRAPSPRPELGHLGISLDAQGGVAQDSMAEQYHRNSMADQYRREYEHDQELRRQQQDPQHPTQHVDAYGRPVSQFTGYPGQTQQHPAAAPPPDHRGSYDERYAPPSQHQQQQVPADHRSSFDDAYVGQAQPQGYHIPPDPRQSYPQAQSYPFPQPTDQYPAGNVASAAYGNYSGVQQPTQSVYPSGQYVNGFTPPPTDYRSASPQPQFPSQNQSAQPQQHNRSPSPQPNVPPANVPATTEFTSTGKPILFYVQALYNYEAQSAAEFDFQMGDIIAVTAHPEDGWWAGELLDEARRAPDKTDFPSNFVTLF